MKLYQLLLAIVIMGIVSSILFPLFVGPVNITNITDSSPCPVSCVDPEAARIAHEMYLHNLHRIAKN
jgi:hypothetical protein